MIQHFPSWSGYLASGLQYRPAIVLAGRNKGSKARVVTIMLLLLPLSILTCFHVMANELEIGGFGRPDGAITAFFSGDFVDPYFATKSLLIARESGLEADKPIKSWIAWALKRQDANGLFGRYRLTVNGGWETVSASDADDSILALWLELLYTSHDTKSLPEDWQHSITIAENQLDQLYDKNTGIYHISASVPVGLLMDNAEIYTAFVTIAAALDKKGLAEKASHYREKSEQLHTAILNVFASGNQDIFLVSTQGINGNKFYPDRAAQLFPVIHQLIAPEQSAIRYKKWINDNQAEWLAQRTEDYPWGLFALLSLTMKDDYSAACWRSHAEPMRYSKHWNILEEVALQVVKDHMEKVMSPHMVPCVKGTFL